MSITEQEFHQINTERVRIENAYGSLASMLFYDFVVTVTNPNDNTLTLDQIMFVGELIARGKARK